MALQSYRSVASARRLPAYVRSDRLRMECGELSQMGADALWAAHDHPRIKRGGCGAPSLLDGKIELAGRMLSSCGLCERKCGANRAAGELGFCGVGAASRYYLEQTLWGEEPPLAPSHEIFFSGCNLRCKYCYSWKSVLDPTCGSIVEPSALAQLIDKRRGEGAGNVNLIGGEPTVHLPHILAALKRVTTPTAVVWNSNFYMSAQTMRLLEGVVDLYLGDFRFGSDECARKLGGVGDYFVVAARNFTLAAQSGDLIIRHLVVPGHIDCCLRPVAEWVARNLPKTPFNLMFQYTPCHQALEDPGLCRALTPEEEERATRIVNSLGLNTTKWKRPLRRHGGNDDVGSGELATTITIRPDGRVGFMHLHGELLEIANALAGGDQS